VAILENLEMRTLIMRTVSYYPRRMNTFLEFILSLALASEGIELRTMVKPSTLTVTATVASAVVVVAAQHQHYSGNNLRGGGGGETASTTTTRDVSTATTTMTTALGALLRAGGVTNLTAEFNEVLRRHDLAGEAEDDSESDRELKKKKEKKEKQKKKDKKKRRLGEQSDSDELSWREFRFDGSFQEDQSMVIS
jgi:hypothetical protein